MNYIYKIIILLNVFIFFSCSNREKCLQNFYQAEKAFSDQNFITAMKYAESSIKEDSSFLNSKILIGKIYFFNNQIELAYQTFKKLNKKEPYSQDVLLYLIRTCIELEKIDEAENLIKRGLHCSDASEDLREDYIDLLNHQNLKFYIGYKKLDTPKSYEDTYISILQKLLQDRLLNTKYGVVQIFIEKNEKVPQKHINALFKLSHIIFADKTNILLSLADFALAYFRYYATSTARNRHVLFFEKLRGKYKVIKNIDNLNTFTRRRPFYPELF